MHLLLIFNIFSNQKYFYLSVLNKPDFRIGKAIQDKMFQRQLRTLDYPKSEQFQVDNPQQFRQAVNWLEASKLRTGKGFSLKDTYAANWDKEFNEYLQ